jgi:DNA replication and repair protein RecF
MFVLESIQLQQFRCYKQSYMEFSPNLNIIVGDNAVGKTSLVEAIYCLGFTKSYKTSTDQEVIQKEAAFASIKGNFEDEKGKQTVFMSFSEQGKRILQNAKPYSRLSDYIGYCNVVLFCPEDLELIKGSPVSRRKFLDTNIAQVRPSYLKALMNFKRVLKQRNEWLKQIEESKNVDQDMFYVLTKRLAHESRVIIEERNAFIHQINPYILINSEKISSENEKTQLAYEPNCSAETIEKELFSRMSIDLAAKTTTIGPHRDDFSVWINKERADIYASQGQQRTAALSMKLGLADLFQTTTDHILIVLDDVFSELDAVRQNELLQLLSKNMQIFITTTSTKDLASDILEKSKLIEIHKEGGQDER